MRNLETERREEEREKANVVNSLWYWLWPFLAWLFVTIVLLVLQLSLDSFLRWWVLIVISLSFGGIAQAVGWLLYYVKKNQAYEIQESVKYQNPNEFDAYVIEKAKSWKSHPVNLSLYHNVQGRRGIRTMQTVGGGGSSATEVYVRKFKDENILSNAFYFVAARVHQPDTLSVVSTTYEPTEEDEKEIVRMLTDDLALVPARYRETTVKVLNNMTGNEQTSVVREPFESQVVGKEPEKGKEELEED